jgi:uncharacterized protein
MPAASQHRSSAASSDARRSSATPWVVELRELGRRAGSLHEFQRTLPAPAGWRVEMIGVPEGADVDLRLRLESVMEGVLVSGEVDAPLAGSCARCLEPVEDRLEIDVQELFAYSGSTTEATSEEDEVRLVEHDTIDLEPMIRDAVVLSLPLAPVCTDDCRGLCADCGQRLADLPSDHAHAVVDPRWAGLAGRFDDPEEN